MAFLRIVGDVHAQVEAEDLLRHRPKPYLQIIAEAPYSVQLGDMGDGESYRQLIHLVDPVRHRFIPGNHDHYDQLPPHSLGDFGTIHIGGIDCFFIRGAESPDRKELVRRGNEIGRKLWFEQEQLDDERMAAAEQEYLRARPTLVLSHDAPTDIARFAWQHRRLFSRGNLSSVFQPSRTNEFLERLRERHSPRLWAFGHHHQNWKYKERETLFVCVGELSYIDIDRHGAICGE